MRWSCIDNANAWRCLCTTAWPNDPAPVAAPIALPHLLHVRRDRERARGTRGLACTTRTRTLPLKLGRMGMHRSLCAQVRVGDGRQLAGRDVEHHGIRADPPGDVAVGCASGRGALLRRRDRMRLLRRCSWRADANELERRAEDAEVGGVAAVASEWGVGDGRDEIEAAGAAIAGRWGGRGDLPCSVR